MPESTDTLLKETAKALARKTWGPCPIGGRQYLSRRVRIEKVQVLAWLYATWQEREFPWSEALALLRKLFGEEVPACVIPTVLTQGNCLEKLRSEGCITWYRLARGGLIILHTNTAAKTGVSDTLMSLSQFEQRRAVMTQKV